MKSTRSFLLWIVFVPFLAGAQTGLAKRSLKLIEKGAFENSLKLIEKGSLKDSINPEISFVRAVLFFDTTYQRFNIDSAYIETNRSMALLAEVDAKRLKKMKRLPLDSTVLLQFRASIDSAAFQRARLADTEDAYIYFIGFFTEAVELDSARQLRNARAYETALKLNTYQSYKIFLDKYPDARQVADARTRYEELLFLDRTKDSKLSSFEAFLTENPQTPFRHIIIKNIFEISTASADESAWLNFIKRFPNEKHSKRAKDILYHQRKTFAQPDKWLSGIANDSLRAVASIEKHRLFPFIWQGKYGFFNDEGEELIKSIYTEIDDEYLCHEIDTDYLLVNNLIYARNGALLYKSAFTDVEDIGSGFLLIENRNCNRVLHKSGFSIGDTCLDDAQVLNNSFLAIKQKDWALFAFNGRQLSDYVFKDVQVMENLIVLKHSNGKSSIHTVKEIAQLADKVALGMQHLYDEVRPWSEGLLWVRRGNAEALINDQLRFQVPLAAQQLSSSRYGLLAKTDKGYRFPGHEQLTANNYEDIVTSANWLALKEEGNWKFWWPHMQAFSAATYDSLGVLGIAPFAYRADSAFLLLMDNSEKYIDPKLNLKYIGAADDAFYVQVDDRNRSYIHDSHFRRLFRNDFENISTIAPGLFVFEQKGKKGLLNAEGKVVVKPEYNAFAQSSFASVSTLKDRKFGLYNLHKNALVPVDYERNIQFYTDEVLIAFQNGFYGFIDWKNKALSGFEFEAVEHWNDSVAIVKQHFQWKLFDFKTKSFAMEGIKSYKLISNDAEEIIAIINHENGFGVISNVQGVIIAPSFSEIINLGSAQEPFYFTEKHVEEAEYFVVVYYNKNGEVVKRQAFEAKEYDKIYCKQK
ncbi:MAG TPA: WG repeat-containing protein [Cyclobacteriaceae bacterium]|nr:WG repeat-containing protein [Cyclobacteriaceae bacterium]